MRGEKRRRPMHCRPAPTLEPGVLFIAERAGGRLSDVDNFNSDVAKINTACRRLALKPRVDRVFSLVSNLHS